MRIAVVGGGVSGLVCAYTLAKHGVEVVLYEKHDYLGGHAQNLSLDHGIDLDLSFMTCNQVICSDTLELLNELEMDVETSEMSFGVSVDNVNGDLCEYSSKNIISGMFSQRKNVVNFRFWKMLYEIYKFKNHALEYLDKVKINDDSANAKETLGHFIHSNGYTKEFQEYYLIPLCSSIWSCSSEQLMGFSAFLVLSYCKTLFQFFGQPQCITIKGGSKSYVKKIGEELKKKGEIKTGCYVERVIATENGVIVNVNGKEEFYNKCIISANGHDALGILGMDATIEERQVLGAYLYVKSDMYVHRDKDMMPKNTSAWSTLNFVGNKDNHVCVTHWLNTFKNLSNTSPLCLVTMNPPQVPRNEIMRWTTNYPIPSLAAFEASKLFYKIQGKRDIWFCSAYQGYGLQEYGLKAGLQVGNEVLGLIKEVSRGKAQMFPTWSEIGCRILVINFLKKYTRTGCICLHEYGGTMLQFQGKEKGCDKKVILQIHKPAFYWKVATRMDLGLADSYIDGDFTTLDKEYGLLNLLMICIANNDISINARKEYRRGWWTPMLPTAGYGSALSYMKHMFKRNTLTQARRNISKHYDLSNAMFSLFLDDTMSYSCGIFNKLGEPQTDAHVRKYLSLIKKARIDRTHDILEIGCGWGGLAIEVVKLTGCKYTGVTLSQEQFNYAQEKVRNVGLEEKITLLLCDYREIPRIPKYDRIISCEMIEGVGYEYYEDFFDVCEKTLRDNGLLVLQFTAVPDQQFDEHRKSPGFMKEYIFPGGCLPSFDKLTTTMINASKLCVENVENIGPHYYYTFMEWRKSFHKNKSDIMKLGFSKEFINMWDYYLVYCAAGFRTLSLLNYQVVFSRPGNLKTLWNDQDATFPKIIVHN